MKEIECPSWLGRVQRISHREYSPREYTETLSLDEDAMPEKPLPGEWEKMMSSLFFSDEMMPVLVYSH
jgi:hypothetical protein